MQPNQIYELFDENFRCFREYPFVLYGLGINTKHIIDKAQGYNIIGIAAKDRIGEIIYGKKIMSVDAVPGKAKIIVILAHVQSIKTIYERIKHLEDSGVMVFDLYGKRLKDLYNEESPNTDNFPTLESASLMSPYERMLCSSVTDIVRYASNKCDHKILNLFFLKAFNDPLSFVEAKGKPIIDSMYKLGYYCFAPITVQFLSWLVKELENQENSIVLFSSRDGYLLFELYQLIKREKPELKLPDAEYLYISRRATTVACIQKESDIIDIVASVLNLSIGNLRKILEQRLGTVFDKCDQILNRSLTDILGKNEIHKISARVLEYKSKILENATRERGNYLKYLQNINVNSYKNIFLFDLYSRGTNTTNLIKLLNRKIKLLCFAVKDYPNEYINSENDFRSMFDSSKVMSGEWFRRGYQLLEIVYSSPEGQLKCFDNSGSPLFVENSQYNFEFINEVQKGIRAFINDLDAADDKWYRGVYSLDMVDFMIEMLLPKYSIVSSEIRNGFLYHDSFSLDKAINIWDCIV